MTDLAGWVLDAARLPLAFAQVREDSLLDLDVLERMGGGDRRVLMIGSGGCTAAALAGSGRVGHLHLVDVNLAQMALCRVKLHLLRTAPSRQRLALLGHSPMPAVRRMMPMAEVLNAIGLPADALGPPPLVAQCGSDHAGRYEVLFERLRMEMNTLGNFKSGISNVKFEVPQGWSDLLNLNDPIERSNRLAPESPFGRALDAALDRVMALPNLIHLFGPGATGNSREPFSRHFARRIRHAVAAMPTSNNPYLSQMLIGRFPDGVASPWLTIPCPDRMPEVKESICSINEALAAVDETYDFIHLSNILDWLPLDEARETLELAWKALRPGGYALIRQLNSTLDIPSLGPRWEWLTEDADALHARDRSFFYRALHLGRKR